MVQYLYYLVLSPRRAKKKGCAADLVEYSTEEKKTDDDDEPSLHTTTVRLQLDTISHSRHRKIFTLAALHLGTDRPLHMTHVIVLKLNYVGYGLDEIKQLLSYQVTPVEEILRDMKESGAFPNAVLQDWREIGLNLSPQTPMLEAYAPGSRLYIPTVFWCTSSAQKYKAFFLMQSFVPSSSLQTFTSMFTLDKAQLDVVAEDAFRQLQSLQLPTTN
jgi:hypothetical protein